MSENSVESIGLCLSEDNSRFTFSDETGEAHSELKSISIESLSLTKISAANTGNFPSENPPLLITLPLEGDELPVQHDRPLNFLSLSQQNTSTSGVTTTLEGTLDDIPDFQEIQPLTSVVVNKKNIVDTSDGIDKTRDQPESGSGLQQSPPSRTTFLTSESNFMDEVKKHNRMKQSSSIKSFASTTAQKTSTSGVTVVEAKPTTHNPSKKLVLDKNEQPVPDHSVGSVKSDTVQGLSQSISTSSSSESKASSMTVFKKFTPELKFGNKPFLLHLPDDDSTDHDSSSDRRPTKSRKVLGDLGNNKPKKTSHHNRGSCPSLSSSSRSEKVPSKSANKQKSRIDPINRSDIKVLIREEMTAVVGMQNDIWHKILDSFVEKASNNVQHQQPKPTDSTSPKDMVMLQLPSEEPEFRLKPLDIPIIKPTKPPKGKQILLSLEPDEIVPDKIGVQESEQNENGPSIKRNNFLDVSIQTTDTDRDTQKIFVEMGVQYDPDKPKHHVVMKPPSENPAYQKVINDQNSQFKVIEQCKMLLESIQHSADEIKEMKREAIQSKPSDKPQVKPITDQESRPRSPAKNKHEIFLEKFFNEDDKTKAPRKYLDVVDLPTNSSKSGHFELLQERKLSQFVYSVDIDSFGQTYSKTRYTKHVQHEKRKVKKLKKNKPSNEPALKKPTPSFDDDKLRRSEVFKAKNELVRSNDVPSNSPPPPKCTSPGEISEISEQLSSISKYLSEDGNQNDDQDLDSISDKTIENIVQDDGDSITSSSQKDKSSRTEPKSDHSNRQAYNQEENIAPIEHSTPKRLDNIHIPSDDFSDSLENIKQPGPRMVNPSLLSKRIAENLSKMKENYNDSQMRELDRTKKVNMLLQNRGKKDGQVTKPVNHVTKPSQPLSDNKPSKKSETFKTPRSVIQKPVIIPSKSISRAGPEFKPIPRPTSQVSQVSSDTSLPSNTEDLLKAALGSDTTITKDIENLKPDKRLENRKISSKPTSNNNEKREVESWMLQKRKERMTAYKNEQAAKIKQEARPFVKKNTTTSQPPKRSEFDRKAAIIRRLNMAEELYNDIQKTPKPVITKPETNQDRTTEWVTGLNLDELDSIHTQSLGSEHGASQITEGISLP